MRKRAKHLGPWAVSLLVLFLVSSSWGAEKKKTASPEELKDKALKVFLDGQNLQWDYIRTEIPFINYVRDRKDADVHVLITTQATGSGGSEYAMASSARATIPI